MEHESILPSGFKWKLFPILSINHEDKNYGYYIISDDQKFILANADDNQVDAVAIDCDQNKLGNNATVFELTLHEYVNGSIANYMVKASNLDGDSEFEFSLNMTTGI